MGSCRALYRIDDEHERHTTRQVFVDLRTHLRWSVVRRQHFDREVGRASDESTRVWLGNAIEPDEGDVGASDGVRVRGELEPNLVHDRSEMVLLDVTMQSSTESLDDAAVL